MRIKGLKVHNYRSIADLEMECNPLVTLIGPNNHGKSNLLSALEFGLSASSKPVEQDLFIGRDTRDNACWIEMTFCDLTDQEKERLGHYVMSNGSVCIRKTAHLNDGAITVTYNGYVDQPNEAWLQGEKASEYVIRDRINETPLKDMVPSGGKLSKATVEDAQQKYIDQHRGELAFENIVEPGPMFGLKTMPGGVLPDFYLIPAVRDLNDEIKAKATTMFGRLLNRAVREMAERDSRFIEARNKLNEVVAALNARDAGKDQDNQLAVLEQSIEEEMKSWGVSVNIEVAPPELEKLFELGTDVHLNDGVKTTVDRKGHGIQRAMIFALLRAWSKVLIRGKDANGEGDISTGKQPDSVIFAMEEPELFLHPHAQRRLAVSLREIAQTSEHQVFASTHSTHFVDLEYYNEISVIIKNNPTDSTNVRQCTTELFAGDDIKERKRRFHMAHWINPDRGEMFFAQRAVFVEGETEKVLLPYVAKNIGFFNPEVSIIDCGSKHNLPLYIAIAKAFEIPFLVIHDEDPLPDPIPDDWNEDKKREKTRTFALNSEIEHLVETSLGAVKVFSPDFEEANGISRSQGDEKGKALAALDHFENVDEDGMSKQLRDVVEAAYAV